MIAALVLAAGASTRMGTNKLLLPLRGRTVLACAVEPFLAAGLERVVLVLGCEAEAVRAKAGLPADPRLRVVTNERWAGGLSMSLIRGLEECGAADAVLVALGDQPEVSADLVRRLADAGRGGASLALPVHDGRAGHPVLFGRSLWGELRSLRGDVGAREVVRGHLAEAVLVAGEGARDLDTAEDYQALLEDRPGRQDEGWVLD